MQKRKNKVNNPFFWLIVITVLPMLIGWLLYHYHDHFQFKSLNHGVLVNPPVAFHYGTENKWQIVYLSNGCCDKQCDDKLFTLHQLRKALGKNQERVGLSLAVSPACHLTETHDFQKIILTEQQYKTLQDQHISPNQIYLVDPLGNLFMSYRLTTDPMNILKDMKKVLEVSQIG